MSALQSLVDALGTRLQRSVALDDPRLKLQVYSPHYGPVDKTRLDSILHREAPDEATSWVLSQGIASLEEPRHVKGDETFEFMTRVCAPVRCQSLLLGYLWVIDEDESLNEAALALCEETAEAIGVVMYREQLLTELEQGRQRELMRDLLANDRELRVYAADQLTTSDLFVANVPVVAMVVRAGPATADGPALDESQRLSISHALEIASRSFPAREALHLTRLDHGLLLVAARGKGKRTEPMAIAESMQTQVAKALGPSFKVRVGIGGKSDSLAGVHHSYGEAQQAVRVAEIIPTFGTVTSFDALGIYGLLSRLPQQQLNLDTLHPGLVALLNVGGDLLQTLEVYLDNACDAQASANLLSVHRTSLYYRLSKIDQVTGLSLSNGADRLVLHLGLKLARLIGAHPGP